MSDPQPLQYKVHIFIALWCDETESTRKTCGGMEMHSSDLLGEQLPSSGSNSTFVRRPRVPGPLPADDWAQWVR